MTKTKLIQINTVCNTSTGHIMGDIARGANEAGFDTMIIYGRRMPFDDLNCVKVGNSAFFWLHVALTTAFDLQGLGSILITRKIVNILRRENPDIIHLHNIHGYYLNYPILFKYLRNEFKGRVFWTLHDCWAFTGHCAHYVAAGCDKWKTGCSHCPCKNEYPISWGLDSSKGNYARKKKFFSGIPNMTLIVPSDWLKNQVQESFLKDYRTIVVNNGIDVKRFSYNKCEDIRDKYGIADGKKIILGVSSVWNRKKGFDDFIKLSEVLPDDYVIVLVGLSPSQKVTLPKNIVGVVKTADQDELIKLYSEAYIFMNPSLEESFSLVTVEAMSCGLPAIVLDTSAVGDLVSPEVGVVLHEHESEDYLNAIKNIDDKIKAGEYDRSSISEYAGRYSKASMINSMLKIYNENRDKDYE
ncbi:glycosyltransferase [Butyrivibrio fibrisolvens]|uniref:Glycosyl transferase n=1 Tax=Butyrivibrio fibrisolvens TaxID=831 RepID=A0A317G1B9_BUTFI|nr:glycosyltransferase [Butyrivibrio fibrisolvens]PWT26190.1 glycosyl transferase [Butyrivibrio fibrisolvens]